MSNFILKEESLEEFRGNGSRGLDAATLSSSAFGVCCWQRHKGICSWIGPLSGDGILFPELSVPLERRRQSVRSKPAWARRGAGLLTPQPAVPWGWGLADSRAPGSARLLAPRAPPSLPWNIARAWWKVQGHRLDGCLSSDSFSPRSTRKLLVWADTVTSDCNNRVFLSFSALCT